MASRLLYVGPRARPGAAAWLAVVLIDGVLTSAVKVVTSYAEAVTRQRENDCADVLLGDDVLEEMVEAGVGPEPEAQLAPVGPAPTTTAEDPPPPTAEPDAEPAIWDLLTVDSDEEPGGQAS